MFRKSPECFAVKLMAFRWQYDHSSAPQLNLFLFEKGKMFLTAVKAFEAKADWVNKNITAVFRIRLLYRYRPQTLNFFIRNNKKVCCLCFQQFVKGLFWHTNAPKIQFKQYNCEILLLFKISVFYVKMYKMQFISVNKAEFSASLL